MHVHWDYHGLVSAVAVNSLSVKKLLKLLIQCNFLFVYNILATNTICLLYSVVRSVCLAIVL